MDVTNFFKEYNRMCEKYAKGNCVGCPLKDKDCFGYFVLDSLKTDYIIEETEKWLKEHPRKTMAQDFFEKFPNAPRDKNNFPKAICPSDCGYESEEVNCHGDCLECWSRPLEK